MASASRRETDAQTQLIHEFGQLSLPQQLEVIQAALRIVAQRVLAVEQPSNRQDEHKSVAEAADLLLADYQEDEELTSFTALDGEPFYAQG